MSRTPKLGALGDSVTQPERVAVPSTRRAPQPAESRFIPKAPRSHPAQEQTHMAPAPRSPPPRCREGEDRMFQTQIRSPLESFNTYRAVRNICAGFGAGRQIVFCMQ
jgi:hypothetical protein